MMKMFNDSGFDKLFINPVTIKPLPGNLPVEAPPVVSGIRVSPTHAIPTVPAVAVSASTPMPPPIQVAKSVVPMSSRLPAPPRISSDTTWQLIRTIVLLAGAFYLVHTLRKMNEEEPN